MENYETLTASGKGTWDRPYEINLVTFTRLYHSYGIDKDREIIEYCIRFKKPRGKKSDIRIFSSENERSNFLAKNFTDLKLSPIDVPQPVLVKYPLIDLIGRELYSIIFFMDYVQVDFNGPKINFYYRPLIYNGQKVFEFKDIRYHKEFCDFIGKKVNVIDEYLDLGLVIEFEDHCLINVPLKVGESYLIPEIAEYHGENYEWIMWQAGDPPFE
jgi:hypothetical protein